RDDGEQPYADARERYAENEAEIENDAPHPNTGRGALTDEEKRELEEDAAEHRFERIGREVSDEHKSQDGDGNHGH
ncbi:MAG TPA: hypothetical protein VNZ58_05570, partial [Thermomicrobiales bacterium]|nr:hypothetical protein [Thermomicrobiales bacterium]